MHLRTNIQTGTVAPRVALTILSLFIAPAFARAQCAVGGCVTYAAPAQHRMAAPQYRGRSAYGYTYAQPAARYVYAQPAQGTTYAQPAPGYTYAQPAAQPTTRYTAMRPTYDAAVQPAAAPAAAAPAAAAPAAASSGDPYGFTNWLNATRAQHGLAPVAFDANLAHWAAQNSAQQNARGLGHFVMGPARRQNSAMGTSATIGTQWMGSPAHRAALLDPSIRAIGLAAVGAYWTFNAY